MITASQHYAASALVTSLAAFLFGFFVFFKSPNRELARKFCWYSYCIAHWSFFVFICTSNRDYSMSYLFAQVCHVIGVFIPIAFLDFVRIFIKNTSKIVLMLIRAVYLIMFLLSGVVLIHPRLFVRDVVPKLTFPFFPTPGPLFILWNAIFVFCVLVALWLLLVDKRNKEKGEHKKVKIFFIANALGYAGGIGCFFPVYGIDFFPFPFGIWGVFFFVFATFYATLRYQFIDIEVIIKKTLVFAGLFLMMMAVVAAVTALTQSVISSFVQVPQTIATMLSLLISLGLYDPVRKWLVNATDKYLFQKSFKLTKIVAEASEAIAFIQSLKWLARRIIAFLVLKCRIKEAAVYVHDPVGRQYRLEAVRGFASRPLPDRLPLNHPVVIALLAKEETLERTRFEDEVDKLAKAKKAKQIELALLTFFHDHKLEVIIPSFLRGKIETAGIGKEKMPAEKERDKSLRNILVLGSKKSDEPYNDDELEVFYSLAQESAIAVENARLYDEAVKRSEELRAMNDELGNANQRLQVTQASLIVAEKNATMVGMAKAIGHEVNNPLTSVMLRNIKISTMHLKKCMDLLQRHKASLPEEDWLKLEKTLQLIEADSAAVDKSAKRINAVVHTLTNILKNTKGEIEPLSLIIMMREAVEATRFSTYEENLSGCEIEVDVASNLMIMGNLDQLLQVFVNLIKNSYEAMVGQRNRKIVITGYTDPETPSMARIELTDNGPGIPGDILPKIWLQGFSTKQKKDDSIGAAGQGQGLYVCKHMIESVHKGRMVCESEVGKGTKFIIWLPLAEHKEIGES